MYLTQNKAIPPFSLKTVVKEAFVFIELWKKIKFADESEKKVFI